MDDQPAGLPRDPHGLEPWGIEGGYVDGLGTWREPTAEVAGLLRSAMGGDPHDPRVPPPAGPSCTVVRAGAPGTVTVGPGTTLELEDGTTLPLPSGSLPADLPVGYHRLVHAGGEADHLLVSPGRCVLPADLRAWGITAQLFATRSTRSWGIGDLTDLRTLVGWARERGAGFVGLNPLHAPAPGPHPADSPYSPSSRRWRNPLDLAVEEVAGFADLDDAADLVAQGRSLNAGERIDRTAVWAAKRRALERLWDRFPGDPAFDGFLAEHGSELTRWGVFCTVADRAGGSWRRWPDALGRPDGSGIAALARDQPREVGFWCWLQWLCDLQLEATGAGDLLVADLAVGIDPNGFDAWDWQDLVADGVRVGAPPDPLGRDGQNWGLPPFVPWRLRSVGYEPFARTLRAGFRHARGLRIDHVMGLFRILWIPAGYGAVDGAYVRYAGTELLDVVAIESHRAGGLVVGEDLGTVEAGVRETLAGAGVLSTRLLWFEDEPPERWPHQAMAAVTTHDLPTIAGVWSGVDLADQRAAGVTLAPDGDERLRHRLRVASGRSDEAPVGDVVVDAHARLAGSGAMVVTATLDDLLGAVHRPNLPGTIDEHPNWRIPLPVPLDELDGHPLAEAVAAALRAADR